MSSEIPPPAYRIHTSRLIIRCYDPSDAHLLKTAIDENLDHLQPWMPWAIDEPTDLQTKIERLRQFRARFDLGKDFTYGIFSLDGAKLLGSTGLHTRVGHGAREIGYWIHKDYLNRGLATEAAAALTKVAFWIDKVDRVEIHCDPKNVRSAAVPRKLGYTHEATLHRRDRDSEGKPRDTMIWTLFAQDFPSSPASDVQIEAYDVTGRRIL